MGRLVELLRVEQGDKGTFGVLRLDGDAFCVTLEPPDRDNQRGVSCIPEGDFLCRSVESPRFGRTYQVVGVPDRDHILFHAGNLARDTEGCVLLGSSFGQLEGERAVLRSGPALRAFLDALEGEPEFSLRVRAVAA